jgi:hypothetical protein
MRLYVNMGESSPTKGWVCIMKEKQAEEGYICPNIAVLGKKNRELKERSD